jgi:tRNA(Ile2) C34 agmatinyltransferase TiaS
MNLDDDCTVMTDMPLSDEVADFIEMGLRRDMTKEDAEEWCDQNLENVVAIYEKYRGTYLSYGQADMTLFFAQTIYERDDARDMISQFIDFQ